LADWNRRYGYRPVLLESFVESPRFKGTSDKAANWICVGQTQGRGKLEKQHRQACALKQIWLYPLLETAAEKCGGVMCVTGRSKTAASSITMKDVRRYGKLERDTQASIG
jgi:hypothetical protein